MGGRGGSSMGGRWGLPRGARAITVTTEIGGKASTSTYFQNEHGLLMRADAVGTTVGTPAGLSGASVSALYRNAVRRGLKFELHTQRQVDAANALYRENRESSKLDVTRGELHPQAGKSGQHAKRLLTTKARAKGGKP